METAFVIYVLYVAVILIWSSSSQPDTQLRYLVVSTALLKKGLFLNANSLVIELQPTQPGVRPVTCLPNALVVSRAEFGSLVRWTPPGATLVFCAYEGGRRLDWLAEKSLLELGIDTVYWADMQRDYTPEHNTEKATAASAKTVSYIARRAAGNLPPSVPIEEELL